MNEVTIFNSPQFGQIRTLTIDGEPWFVGKDVAIALGYKDTVNALKQHVDSEDKKLGWRFTTPAGSREAVVINESGLYSLIMSSKLTEAKKFKRWVTSEVLPAIRKTGGYLGGNIEEIITKTVTATATAVVTEVMKQIMPLVSDYVPIDHISNLRYAEMTEPKPRRKETPCIISRLDLEARQMVDEMLMTDRYGYADIQSYLRDLGVHVSIAAIHRYRNRLRG